MLARLLQPFSLCVLAVSVLWLGVAAAQENTNSTRQVGQVNINRTQQCGEENQNATYQEGRVNINRTSQGCPGNGAQGRSTGRSAAPRAKGPADERGKAAAAGRGRSG